MCTAAVDRAFSEGAFAVGLAAVFDAVAVANRYFTEQKPWTLRERRTPEDARRLDTILHVALSAVRTASLLLQPVVPAGAARMLDRLGVPTDARQVAHMLSAAPGRAQRPGRPLGAVAPEGLFPRLAAPTATAAPGRKR